MMAVGNFFQVKYLGSGIYPCIIFGFHPMIIEDTENPCYQAQSEIIKLEERSNYLKLNKTESANLWQAATLSFNEF